MLYTKKVPRETPREKSKRPQLSCNSCRARKVRCDRLQPCSACSMHQSSDQCHYELSPDERKPIQQAEHIRHLTRRVAYLEAQVLSLGGTIDDDDQFEIRKKRKTGLTLRSDESQMSSQYPSPQLRGLTCTPPQAESTHPDAASPHLSRRAKSGPNSISIPSPDSGGSIATYCSHSTQVWSDSDNNTAEWPIGPKRTFSSPNYPIRDHSKAHRAKVPVAGKQIPPSNLQLGGSDGEPMALSHPQKLWDTACYPTASGAISVPTTASFLSFSTANLMPPLTTAGYTTSSSSSYPQSLSTCSSASYPPSNYAHSASSSLHTPSPSHPVSPTLSQHQPCCASQPQTQPPSPLWGFDSGVPNTNPNHPFVHSENASAAALIAELAAHDDKDSMNQWQWKLAWAG